MLNTPFVLCIINVDRRKKFPEILLIFEKGSKWNKTGYSHSAQNTPPMRETNCADEVRILVNSVAKSGRISWSPDGQIIAVTSPDPERVAESRFGDEEIFERYWQIYLLDVSKIINSN